MTKVLSGIRRLFDGADAELYSLPEQIVQLRRALAALAEHVVPVPAPPMAVLDELVERTRQAAKAGHPLPDAGAVIAAEDAARIYDHQRRVIADAIERTESELISKVTTAADEIITEHLRPAHDGIVARIGEAAEVTAQYPTALSALAAGAKVRSAFAELPSLCQTHGALMSARSAVVRLPGCEPTHGDSPVSWVENAEEIWPSMEWSRGRPPWPEDADAALLWLLRNGAKLWLPTAAEEDAAFERTPVFEAMQQTRRNASNLEGLRQIYSPSPEKLAGTAEGRNPIAAGLDRAAAAIGQ